MNWMRFFVPAAAVVSLGLWANSASADGYGQGIGNCWFGNLNAYGASGTLYGSGYLHVPPYYAIHPPVYYSHQYYRPYGWTPFAQPSHIAPAALRPEPRMIVNPHVPVQEVKKPQPDHTAKSQMIVNPYFVKAQATGQGRLASQQP